MDDEDFIRENAVEYLKFYCDNVYEAKDGEDGLIKYNKYKPDIIITDIKMPKLNGLNMIKRIRQKDKLSKIIVATAFLETSYLLEAIELGLIKYLVKPLSEDNLLPVLKLCIENIIEEKSIFNIDKIFTFDLFNDSLFYKEKQIILTKTELSFLKLLITNRNRVVKYSEFNDKIWNGEMSDNALRSIVKELRKKISKKAIKNVSGIGYQINE
ncbi:response regulator transcription factor [Halarcobacter mediterraneus]|uniref:response regulator transcription factor n=1 Tax=Halarcobacter mediterraneus TaxID=2023153 RepID=UPI001E35004B|nr:response regulator [Halarcobacter mediterraneus]